MVFNRSERKVELEGEAYFEVIHDEKRPFKVAFISNKVDDPFGEVTVLGTHFNVNAYLDENKIKVTLLEGSVKISKFGINGANSIERYIKPGQQSLFKKYSNETISIMDLDEPSDDIAWINGRFSFQSITFSEMMRELSRWYDIDVSYEGNIPTNTIVGEVDRTISLSQLLQTLEKMGYNHFKIEGRKVTVIQ